MKNTLPVNHWKTCLIKVINICERFVLFLIFLFVFLVSNQHKLVAKSCSLYTDSGVKVSNDRVLAALQERNLRYLLKGVRSTETGAAEQNIPSTDSQPVDEIDIDTNEVKKSLHTVFLGVKM
jgi:hypothetical protein